MFDQHAIDDVISLYYDIHYNHFVDEDGQEIDFIFGFVTPDDLYLFHHNKESMCVPHPMLRGVIVELVYPDGCDICENYDCDMNPYFEGYSDEEDEYERIAG
jgi:hypothetical protein